MVTLITAAIATIALLFYSKVPHTLVAWIGENFQWDSTKK